MCFAAVVLLVACFVVFKFLANAASNDIANVKWHAGGHPMAILVKITDVNGVPIANAIVDSESDSGRAGNTAPTDQNGIVAFSAAEREVRAIYVNDECILETRGLFAPSVQGGLVVSIRMLRQTPMPVIKTNQRLHPSGD